jgi:hypothetical protein
MIHMDKRFSIILTAIRQQYTFDAEPFDTLLCLMNGIAVVENLDGLEPFLSSIQRLIKPDGQFLIDSTDRRPERQHGEVSGSGDRYPGAAHLQLEYKIDILPPPNAVALWRGIPSLPPGRFKVLRKRLLACSPKELPAPSVLFFWRHSDPYVSPACIPSNDRFASQA